MVEDKKTDDYTVDMDKLDQGNKEFEAAPPPQPRPSPPSSMSSSPILPVLSYCGSSILMTVMNKYVLSGLDFNLNFLLLMVQVCPAPIEQCIEKESLTWVCYSPSSVSRPFKLASLWA